MESRPAWKSGGADSYLKDGIEDPELNEQYREDASVKDRKLSCAASVRGRSPGSEVLVGFGIGNPTSCSQVAHHSEL